MDKGYGLALAPHTISATGSYYFDNGKVLELYAVQPDRTTNAGFGTISSKEVQTAQRFASSQVTEFTTGRSSRDRLIIEELPSNL